MGGGVGLLDQGVTAPYLQCKPHFPLLAFASLVFVFCMSRKPACVDPLSRCVLNAVSSPRLGLVWLRAAGLKRRGVSQSDEMCPQDTGLRIHTACRPSWGLALWGSTEQSRAKDVVCLPGSLEQWAVSSASAEFSAIDRVEISSFRAAG